jgi:hypothetical protein
VGSLVILDPSELDPQSRYKLLIGSVVPRPIAWTSTVSRDGVRNLAPFSFFTVASRNRPFGSTKLPELRFRALLSKDGADLELARGRL